MKTRIAFIEKIPEDSGTALKSSVDQPSGKHNYPPANGDKSRKKE
jgi:hypothetical protein